MEPILAKAARQLGIDEVEIHKINAPAGKAPFGAPNPRGQQQYVTSAFVKEALDKGAEIFNWSEKKARSGNASARRRAARASRSAPTPRGRPASTAC